MVLLGLLLLAAGLATVASVVLSNADAVTFEVFGQTVTKLSPGGLVLAGVALGMVAGLSLWMIAAGARHRRVRREADRNVVQRERSRANELEEENLRLREAAQRHRATPAMATAPEPIDLSDRADGPAANEASQSQSHETTQA